MEMAEQMTGLIVHEWVGAHGGSEKVVDAMLEAFPAAELLCLWNDAADRFPSVKVRESWLARTPLRRNKALALPLMSRTWRRTNISEYDWALVSSHLFAHHIAYNGRRRKVPTFVY